MVIPGFLIPVIRLNSDSFSVSEPLPPNAGSIVYYQYSPSGYDVSMSNELSTPAFFPANRRASGIQNHFFPVNPGTGVLEKY